MYVGHAYRKWIFLWIAIGHSNRSIKHILWRHFLVVLLLLWLLQAITVHVWTGGDAIHAETVRRTEHIRWVSVAHGKLLLLLVVPSVLCGHSHRGRHWCCLKWIGDGCRLRRIEWIRWIRCSWRMVIFLFHFAQLFVQILESGIPVHRWRRIDWWIRIECAARFQWIAGWTQWHRKTCQIRMHLINIWEYCSVAGRRDHTRGKRNRNQLKWQTETNGRACECVSAVNCCQDEGANKTHFTATTTDYKSYWIFSLAENPYYYIRPKKAMTRENAARCTLRTAGAFEKFKRKQKIPNRFEQTYIWLKTGKKGIVNAWKIRSEFKAKRAKKRKLKCGRI